MEGQPEIAASGLVWPDAYAGLLPAIRDRWGTGDRILLIRQLSGGKSGALVFAADVDTPAFTGQAILKLDQVKHPHTEEAHEADLHRRAIEDSPAFAAAHLPRLIASVHGGGQAAILATIAARGLEYVEPWQSASFEHQMPALRALSRGLLEDWNADYRLSSGVHTPRGLLKGWLGSRLDRDGGRGRLFSMLADECGLDAEAPSLMFEGHWYPNPLAFAHSGTLPDRLAIRAASGHCHGDLHGLNVLLGRQTASEADYYLIDLALYESEQFLFFDHAYFEVATLLMSRGEASVSEWESLLANLGSQHRHDPDFGLRVDDRGLLELFQALRGEVGAWIDAHEADRLSFMDNQYRLARVAAGLNFANKRLPLRTRQMAFLYAASELKDYLHHHRIAWPKEGPAFTIGGPRATAPPPAPPTDAADAAPASGADDADVAADHAAEPARPARGGALGFLSELGRRNVVKVAGIYVVVAWLCLQVVLAVQKALGLPEWTDTLVAVLLAIGLPIACILAWAFELTPAGPRLVRASAGSARPSRSQAATTAAILAGIGLIAALEISDYSMESPPPPQPTAGDPSGLTALAVLPFENLGGGDGHGDDFADGLTIEIMNTLAQTGEFRMPGRTSSIAYKNNPTDLRAIGASLGVDYLLEGSVRRQGDQLRIKAQLIDAKDGYPVWTRLFDETMGDVFTVQEQIANSIGEALAKPLGIKAADLRADRTANVEAYDLYLQGLALLEERGPSLRGAIDVLKKSVAIAPDFAAGWAALSMVYNLVPLYLDTVDDRPVSTAVFYRRAQEAALRAAALDPELPVVRNALGAMYQRNRQWIAAADAYDKGLKADPGDHRMAEGLATLLQIVGKHREAKDLTRSMLEADPRNDLYRVLDAFLRWQADQSEANVGKLEVLFRSAPPFRPLLLRIILGHRTYRGQPELVTPLLEGCTDCAGAWFDRAKALLEAVKTETPEAIYEAYKDDVFVGYQFLYALGGADLALKAFEYWGLSAQRRLQFFTVPWDLIDVLGPTDGFRQTATDMGLVDYWRERGWPDHCRPGDGDTFTCS